MAEKQIFVSIRIPSDMYNLLIKHAEDNMITKSQVVKQALKAFLHPDVCKYPLTPREAIPQEQFETIREAMEEVPDSNTDKEITTQFSLRGEGNNYRLKSMGINPVDVVKAKRAKNHNRPYDISLEKYFSMV